MLAVRFFIYTPELVPLVYPNFNNILPIGMDAFPNIVKHVSICKLRLIYYQSVGLLQSMCEHVFECPLGIIRDKALMFIPKTIDL